MAAPAGRLYPQLRGSKLPSEEPKNLQVEGFWKIMKILLDTINEDLWVSMGVFFSNNQMLLSEGVFHISGMVLYGCFQKWRYPQMNGL